MLILCLFAGLPAFAQKGKGKTTQTRAQQVLDSTRAAQKAALEAQRAERQRITDSTKAARLHFADSVAKVRKHRSDSLAKVSKYRSSKKYKDSVAKARQRVTDSIKAERQLALDAQRDERQRILDSTMAVRKATIDSIRAFQQARSDSLATIREYRESKRYKDSVAFVRQARLDSIRLVRKEFNDSATASRKHIADSAIASRKHILDSTMAVRKAFTDSLTAVRKARSDSLAVVKEKREKLRKQEEKKKQQKMELAIDLKIKQKQSQYTNQDMLKKKWSAPRQLLQNTFTRYNYYFNAYNKMQEAKANMARIGRENYDSMIALYPFNPDKDSTSIAPDMDSIIHKVSLGIQIHDPRTKWGDDLYLLLGEAYYYKGDYKNAGASFRYIIGMNERNKKKSGGSSSYSRKRGETSIVEEDKSSALDFLKHQSVNNEAIMWLSRTFTQAKMPENAEVVLDLVASDPKLPDNLKGNLAMTKAFLLLSSNNFRGAAEQLKIAANDEYLADDKRQRAAYLGGQIYQQEGNYAAANESFQKAIDLHPQIEMDFYARKNLAYNAMYSGENQKEAIASLKKILRDYKYSGYYEQVYFILGSLAANDERAFDAITYLDKSLATTKTTKKQKALSYAALGNVYYRIGDYVSAKNAYDSSAMLAKYAPNDSNVNVAIHRSNVLGAVTGPYLTIRAQDSLLALAALSEKEQRSVVRKYIKMLEQQRLDSIYRAENAGINNVSQNDNVNNGNSGWYFTNATQMKKGQSEFKRIWGNRPAVDNWRRSSAIGVVNSGGNNVVTGDGDDNMQLDENGLPTEQSLLAMIPTSPEKQEKANNLIKHAYVDLADAYVMQLEDYPLAVISLDTLNGRYKNHDEKDRELYLRYVMALRQSRIPDAQKYSAQIQQQFPSSQYVALVKPTEDGANMAGNTTGKESVNGYYEATYALLMQRQYTEVLQRVKTARQKYTGTNYMKRFTVMEGIALAGSGNYPKADTLLRDFIKDNATDTLRPWAEAVLEYVNKNRPAPPKIDTNTNTPPPLPGNTPNTTTTTNPTPGNNVNTKIDIAQPTGEVPPIFAYKPEAEHYCVLSFPGMDSRAVNAKKAITDFNAFRYPALMLESNIDMLSESEGLVTVRKFANEAQAKQYLTALKAATQVFREYQGSEYQLFLVSSPNYQKLLSDHKIKPYLDFYKFYYK